MLTTAVSLTGDAGATSVYVLNNSGTVEFFQNEPKTATPTLSVPYADLGPVTITGGGGATTLTLDYSGGDLFPSGLTFAGEGPTVSPNQLDVVGAPSASYTLGSGSLAITGTAGGSAFSDSITLSTFANLNLFGSGGTSSFEVTSGAFTFNSNLGSSATVDMTVDSGASVAFGATQTLGSLTINSGSSAQMLAAGAQVLDTNTLTVSGILDLTDNDLIVNSPSSMTTLEESVAAGVTGSATEGIIESSTAATDGLTIGVAAESDVVLGTLDGETIPSTALVARYTLLGDTDLNGDDNSADLSNAESNYNEESTAHGTMWYKGDVDYNGDINSADLSIIRGSFDELLPNIYPASTNIGTAYTVTLPTADPAGDGIQRLDVNWGDGTNDSYAAGTTSASHVYTLTGVANIQFAALTLNTTTDTYGTWRAPAQPVVISNTGVTAEPVSLTASAPTDVFNISSDGESNTVITKNGTTVLDEPTENILSLSITGQAAEVAIGFASSDPLPASGIYTDAVVVELDGPHATDSVFTTSTAAYVGNDVIRYPAGTTLSDNLTSDGGVFAIDGTTKLNDEASDALTVITGATVLLNGSQTMSSLIIDPGATVRQISQNTSFGASAITLGSLSIQGPDINGNNGGVLDLGYGDLIVRDTPVSDVEPLLAAGYDNGYWDGEAATGLTQRLS